VQRERHDIVVVLGEEPLLAGRHVLDDRHRGHEVH
jgi:hypothetical protein